MLAKNKKTGILYEVLLKGQLITLYQRDSGKNHEATNIEMFNRDYDLVEGEPKYTTFNEDLLKADILVAKFRGRNTTPKKAKNSTSTNKTLKKGKSTKKKEVKKTPKGTTLKELCDEYKTTPAVARRIFRKGDVEKPGATWTWEDPKEIKKIRSILEKL